MSPNILAGRGRGEAVEDAGDIFGLLADNSTPSALAIIFACANFVQAIFALRNICVRLMGYSPFTKEREFSLGSMFPVFILLSPSLLTAYYVLETILFSSIDDNGVPNVPLYQVFFNAKDTVRVLGDVSLVSALLSLILHREKVLLESPGRWCLTKIITTVLLVLALLGLGMGSSWLLTDGDPGSKIIKRENLVWAYESLFLFAVVNIIISSLMLRKSIIEGRTIVNDHKMINRIAINISLPLVSYAVFLIVKSKFGGAGVVEMWEMANLVLGGLLEFWIILVCLFFGFPVPEKLAKALGWKSDD